MYSRSLLHFVFKSVFAGFALLAGSAFCYADTSFDFSGPPVLVAGNDLQQGAVYRFAAVTAGTDALVEVKALYNATLVQLDASAGVERALQPVIDGDAIGSYVEFSVLFVDSGTSNSSPVTGIFSALDVDSVVEFDTFFNVSDYAVETNSDLTLTVADPQTLEVTGGGPGYSSISAANTSAVVSVSVNELTGFSYRAGVNGDAIRQTSLLFESVNFNTAVFANINDAPKAIADTNQVVRNTPLNVTSENGLLANDSDLDLGIGPDLLEVESITVGVNTYLTNSSINLLEGTLTVNSDGSYEFIPAANYSGSVAVASYQVSDGNGGKDRSTLSLSVLSDGQNEEPPITEDEVSPPVFAVSIDEDVDDNGFISAEELSGVINVSVQLPLEAAVGDTVSIVYGEDSREVDLDANHLSAAKVEFTFDPAFDGDVIQVQATMVDAGLNESALSQDLAIVDVTLPEAPVVTIVADLDNSGFISQQESSDFMSVMVVLPAGVGVNDKLTIITNATSSKIILTPLDIAEGVVTSVIPAPADGDALSVVAQITDEAGNKSASGSDSAMIDITAPAEPVVDQLVSDSATPSITGTLPVDSNYLLSVQVNAVLYASGDGQLSESGGGVWTLVIPPSDAMPDGVYDVNAVVTDMAGNSTVDPSAGELTIDLQAPELSANTIGPSSDNAPVLGGSSDQMDGTLVIVNTESGVRVCQAVLKENAWSCAAQISLAIGINSLVATVMDDAGNSANEVFSVTVAAATDTDQDGIADDLETTDDFDNDGIPNYLDLDSDNDSIPDALETQIDRDGDGARNYLDVDSDNDGLSDLREASVQNDVVDNEGQISSEISVDDNVSVEIVDSGPVAIDGDFPWDTDGDLIPDFLDHDSDGDGISDVVENGHVDTDADAMRTDSLLMAAKDFDGDGIPNYRDLDSDQDGIADIRESPTTDTDGDGMVDSFVDINYDGLADSAAVNFTGVAGGLAQDYDADGSANFLDLDSDGDGKYDLTEAGGSDSDNNGIHDSYLDINANSVPDMIDAQLTRGDDLDGDFIDDQFDTDYTVGVDTDQDGIIDEFDVDSNGNGYADILDDVALLLPDLNGDGRDDLYESDTPARQALLRTGVGGFGSGCSIQRLNSRQTGSPIDFLFLYLLAAAFVGVYRKTMMPDRYRTK